MSKQVAAYLAGFSVHNVGKKPTRIAQLRAALPEGWTVETWSPGDGVTRYRFFHKAPANQSYFGPNNGRFTALGFKEAEAIARGLAA